MKTFTEITEKKLSKLFMEFNSYPQLASFVTNGFPIAVGSYLKKKILEENTDYAEVIIGGPKFGELMKFMLKVVKKGDSTALVPEFELMTAGKDFINSDDLDFDEVAMTNMANDLTENKELVSALNNAFSGKKYVSPDEGWKDISTTNSDDEQGITFDDENDIAMAAVTVVAAIFEVLTNNKDVSSDLEYDVAGIGKFKVSAAKDVFTVALTFDKEFKSICKCDDLLDNLSK